jgi:hypothetical protein
LRRDDDFEAISSSNVIPAQAGIQRLCLTGKHYRTTYAPDSQSNLIANLGQCQLAAGLSRNALNTDVSL